MRPQGIYFHCSMWRFCHMTFVNLFRNPTAESWGTLSMYSCISKTGRQKARICTGGWFCYFGAMFALRGANQEKFCGRGTKNDPFALSGLGRWRHCIAFALLHNPEKALSYSDREGECPELAAQGKGSTPTAVLLRCLFKHPHLAIGEGCLYEAWLFAPWAVSGRPLPHDC